MSHDTNGLPQPVTVQLLFLSLYMLSIQKYLHLLLMTMIFTACGTEKETVDVPQEKDTMSNYAPQEKGTDPAELNLSMSAYRDSGMVNYHGIPLKVLVYFVEPQQDRTTSDAQEMDLLNNNDKKNTLYISMQSKNFDTSFVVYKKYFVDSLGADFLRESVFGTTTFQKLENMDDFIFTTFIGAPNSDDGLLVDFSFNRKKGIRVLSSKYPVMGDE